MLPHLPAVYRAAYYLARTPQEAEDLTQETYLKAFRSFEQRRGENPKPWLFTILRHAYWDRCRRLRREPPTVDLDGCASAHVVPTVPSAEDRVLSNQFGDDVQAALRELPEDWRLLVLLADIEDLSYREIADVLQIPRGTVMSGLSRARRRLYDRLQGFAVRTGYLVADNPMRR